MLIIGLALILGHLNFGHGVVVIAKSSLKWIPFALFPLAGYLVQIQRQVILRAVSILCVQSLCLIPILSLAIVLKLPHELYISPLSAIGGEVSRYAVNLYATDIQESRLVLFAPHCPALGLVGGILFCITLQDTRWKWRWLSIAGSLGMVLFSVSRAAILSIPILIVILISIRFISKPWFHLCLAVSSLIGGIVLPKILMWVEDFQSRFYSFRAGSSRTRAILEQLALNRWEDAPVWGHGLIDATGPLITGEKAIGTHHTWLGMLYTQGIVGFTA
ncbi:MAG: O-antigen ligase family protein, partial [Cyanobacteria bacterium P01_F01_bin.3]